VPVVGAGVSPLLAEPHGGFEFPKDEGLLTSSVQTECVTLTQFYTVVGRIQTLLDRRLRVEAADAFDEPPTFGGSDAALGKEDSRHLKVGRPSGFVVSRQ
jgi:hypothetical protein